MAARNNKKSFSFLKKVKSLFNGNTYSSAGTSAGSYVSRKDDLQTPTDIPGGFFTSELPSRASTSVNATRHGDTTRRALGNLSQSQNADYEDSDSDSYAADTSNARLADFFSKKGDMPLSDIEMEGVLSLMKKASRSGSVRHQSTANSTINEESIDLERSRVLKKSRTSSAAASTFKAPSFMPKYDNSMTSETPGNASFRSTSSRRRVFDYSNFPTPYKTVVYKYSAADGRDESRISSASAVPRLQIKASGSFAGDGGSLPPSKKLSNTASALVSLLENEAAKEVPTAQLSNPYSSLVNPLRDYKKALSRLPAASPESAQEESAVVAGKEEPSNRNEVFDSEPLPKQRQTSQQKNSLNRYKPTRSSSLRSTVTTDEIPAKDDKLETELRDVKGVEEQQVPSAAKFTFTVKDAGKEAASVRESSREQKSPFGFPSGAFNLGSANELTEPTREQQSSNAPSPQNKVVITDDVQRLDQQIKRRNSPCNDTKALSQSIINTSPEKNILFIFDKPLPSGVAASSIDESKVNAYRSMFKF